MAWLDAGSYDGLLEASNFVEAIQKRQALYVACLEEIAFRKVGISRERLLESASEIHTDYGLYLKYIAESD